jgi:WS/DGAT/MGAT family acyltransferase
VPRPNPGRIELGRDEFERRIGRPLRALRDIAAFVAHSTTAPADAIARFRALRGLVEGMFPRPSVAPFNDLLSGQRRLEWLTMPLQSIEGIRGALGGSVNDVVLAIVTSALRRYLSSRKIRVETGVFRALTPVSTRGKDQHGTLGNRVSAWVVDLPVGEPDPGEQLREIHRATRKIKDSKLPTGAAVITEMSEWSSSTLLISMSARHLTRLLPCNLVVTNIPGPQFPVYLLGATLSEAFPFVPLADRLGLNIAVLSYNGKLCWGFNADYNLLPDLDVFVAGIRDAFGDLAALVEPAPKRRTHAGRAPN